MEKRFLNSEAMSLFKMLLAILDGMLIGASYLLGLYLKFGSIVVNQAYSELTRILPLLVFIGIVILYFFGGYSSLFYYSFNKFKRILFALLILSSVFVLYTFFDDNFTYSRYVILYAFLIQLVLINLIRFCITVISTDRHKMPKVLVIGTGEDLEVATLKIIQGKNKIFQVKYMLDVGEYELAPVSEHIPLIDDVDIVLICAGIDFFDRAKIISQCTFKEKKVIIIPEIHEISIENMELNQIGDMPLFLVNELGLSDEKHALKRIFDLLFSASVLAVLWPVFLVVAIAIKLDSKGPVFFLQERVTINNKRFKVIKFRTMVKDAEGLSGPVLASEDDPRITKVGKFLRATRLDEMPQFINVLLGDMSVVGPRPERPHFIEQFKDELPEFEYRVFVKAGITGMAQVAGKYNTAHYDKLKYDLFYIKNYSFAFDMELIFKTIKVVFTKEATEGVKEEEEFDEALDRLGYERVEFSSYSEIVKKAHNI